MKKKAPKNAVAANGPAKDTRFGLELADGHHCFTDIPFPHGFNKIGNRFFLSPGMTEEWTRHRSEQKGLADFIEAQNKFILGEHGRLAAESKRLWDRFFEVVKIPKGSGYIGKTVEPGVIEVFPPKPADDDGPHA